MTNIIFKLKENTEEAAIKLEEMRKKVFEYNDSYNTKTSYYTGEIKEGNILAFTCELNGEEVAGCYVSSALNSLYVEQLFVLQEYQEKGLYLGKKLLQYILDNKKLVEEYFLCKFEYSRISPSTQKAKRIYKSVGYKETNSLLRDMKIKI